MDFAYVWGDALAELERVRPDARIVNLETSVTASEEAWPGKGIHYRMHPANVRCLARRRARLLRARQQSRAWIGVEPGSRSPWQTLARRRHPHGGRRSRRCREAAAPAVIDVSGGGRVLVFAFGMESSGVPAAWARKGERSGVNLLRGSVGARRRRHRAQVRAHKRGGDIVVMSIHWGDNWGYRISPERARLRAAPDRHAPASMSCTATRRTT